MTGIVIVSHSAKLAEGVAELAAQVAQGKVRIVAAGGTRDGGIGTDAFLVKDAMEAADGGGDVLVFTDLGSAVLSAEMALEFLEEPLRSRVRLSSASIVEGAVAAAAQDAASPGITEGETRTATLVNAAGLHARPAARLIRLARTFRSRASVASSNAGPVDATSMSGVLSLAARKGDQLTFRASGEDARETLNALVRFVETGCGDAQSGVGTGEGTAIGPLYRYRPAPLVVEERKADDADAEWRRLESALAATRDALRATGSDIFDAQTLFLEDPSIVGAARRTIFDEGLAADSAWSRAVDAMRAGPDLADAAERVLYTLAGRTPSPAEIPAPSIVLAYDLLPSQVAALDQSKVLGLCLEGGTASAHSAILARSQGIPIITGLGSRLAHVADGTLIGMNGATGEVEPDPDPARYQPRAKAQRHHANTTQDGVPVTVLANLASVEDAQRALDYGADGVGVARTEFLFIHRASAPSEAEQYEAYRSIIEAMGDRVVVIRTLDTGGDKEVPYLDAGGLRGIRLSLAHPEMLAAQLRAIERAARGHHVEVLLPMVSTLEELRAVKSGIPVGVMIETPASVAIADLLGAEACRLSVGTNDLVQHVMVADRTNPRLAKCADPFDPAVLRMLRDVARIKRVPVDVCGEMAADPLAIPILLGLGIREFSVSPPLVPGVRRTVSEWTIANADSLARSALKAATCGEVRALLR